MENYDSSWYNGNQDTWDVKYKEWSERAWEQWLLESLFFPFEVKRVEDDRVFLQQEKSKEPFTLDHTFKIEGIELEDDLYGFIMIAREGRRKGHVPLCDVEVASKTDPNFWLVKEYAVWFANH